MDDDLRDALAEALGAAGFIDIETQRSAGLWIMAARRNSHMITIRLTDRSLAAQRCGAKDSTVDISMWTVPTLPEPP